MNCKHKNKTRLYKRMPTTWTSQDLWVCEDCNAILGIAEIKIKTMKVEPSLREQKKEHFGEESKFGTRRE